jgi:RNA polymerase sigma-70 factor (ECF subfamily)
MAMVGKTTMDKKILDSYIRQIAAGDRDSFRKLYDYVKEPVFLFALSIVKNHHTAEDILQESMHRLTLNIEKYQPGTNPKAWLLSITRNLCNDVLRSPSYRDLPLEEMESLIDEKADVIKLTEENDELSAALQILSQQEREIVFLYVYAGLKQSEIAKTLQIPYIQVRSQYGYALKKMRIHFEKVNSYELEKTHRTPITSVISNTDS